MNHRLHVHVPWRRIEEAFPLLLDHGLQPEIAFKGDDLDDLDREQVRSVARRLASAGLRVSLHAPFADLNPGALEPLVLAATEKRFRQTLEVADALGARLIVFHPGFDRWKYGGLNHLWLEANLDFWPPLLDLAARLDCRMALENIFEQRPDTLAGLLDALDSPWLGHCFDVGHWHLFSTVPLEKWFTALGPRTVHLHLHDNRGRRDDHLPPGQGKIDFDGLYGCIRSLSPLPSLTLEIHVPEDILRSVAALPPFLRD